MDKPIHLADYGITDKAPHSENSATVSVCLTQSSLDGIFELIRFLEGLSRGSGGVVPGAFELTMLYRTLRKSIEGTETLRQNEHGFCGDPPAGYPESSCRWGRNHPACLRNGGPYACGICLVEEREKREAAKKPEGAMRYTVEAGANALPFGAEPIPTPPDSGRSPFKVSKGG